jgi:hypothetical protein
MVGQVYRECRESGSIPSLSGTEMGGQQAQGSTTARVTRVSVLHDADEANAGPKWADGSTGTYCLRLARGSRALTARGVVLR